MSFDGRKFFVPVIVYQKSKQGARAPYISDAASSAEKAGFVYSESSLRWESRNAHKALKLRQWADESAERKLKNTFITELPLPECIPYPHELEPRTFQFDSAWWILGRTPVYCADQQGLGKTVTAVLCMNAVPGKTLIICPPFLKYNWVDEIEKWSTWGERLSFGGWGTVIYVVESGEPDREKLTQSNVVILPDSLMDNATIQHWLKDVKFTWLFIDEAHRYKNEKANRTVALIGSDEDTKDYFQYTNISQRVVFLSGTPLPNGRPMELFPILHRVAPESIGQKNWVEFGVEFCAGRQVTRREGKRVVANWDFSGASNLKAFRRGLRQRFMVRHLKQDVLDELPAKQRKLIFLDAPKEILKLEKRLLSNYSLEELLGEHDQTDRATLGALARHQRELSERKLPLAAAYIEDWLENNTGSILVVAHHVDTVEGLCEELTEYGVLKIRGGMTSKKKHETAQLFQAGGGRVLCVNADAAGVGLTLTKAALGIVVEPSWVPGTNEQVEDRLHRMTQESRVYMHYLVLRGTLDERKLRQVLKKEKNINQVMG